MGNAFARVNGKLFEVVRELHEGGFAHVYEVKRGDKHFALKWTRSVTEGEELERVLLELQVQRQLQHIHVLRLEAAEVRKTHDGEKEALMLFPLATRGSLQSLLEHAAMTGIAAFNETECLHFFAKLLDAVAAVHESGFAHRDIKPANILLSEDDPMEPLLMDFGSVAPLQVQLSGVTEYRKLWEDAARFSSSPYRAPELWEGGDMELVDGRTDVWSLGCVLYALAFGPFSPFEHPRDGVQHLAIMNGYVAFPHDNKHCGQVFSATFTALIKWILTPDVAERPKLHGVRLCMNQLLNPPPRKQVSVKMKRFPLTKPPILRDPEVDEQDWADFSTFDPHPMSSKLSRSSSASKPSLAPNTMKQASVNGRDRGLTDPNRRRALSRTGKQLWAKALEAQT